MAKTAMSYSSTSAAATSSWVDSGLEAQSTTSAPPAFRVRARFAVSVVTCRQAEIRYPESGCSLSKRSRMAASTGIWRSAHSMRRTPSGASARSFTSCRLVVAIQSSPVAVSGGEQALVLALLPVEGGQFRAVQPGLERRAQIRLAAQPCGEGDVGKLDVVALPQVRERPKLVQVQQVVDPIAAGAAPRHDETRLFEVSEHPRRPARPSRRLAYVHALHGLTLTQVCHGAAVPSRP